MKHAVIFQTVNDNHYLYSPFRNQIIICHPLIPILFEIDGKNHGLKNFPNRLTIKQKGNIPELGSYKISEIKTQLKKFYFLKKHGYFKPVQTKNLQGKIHPGLVEDNLGKVRQIIFEITENCNLSCTYCTYSKFYINKKRGQREFRIRDAMSLLTFLLSKRPLKLQQELTLSFYGGEPLKNFRFIEDIVHFVHPYTKQGYNFKFSMSSNGLLLCKHIDFLKKHKFDVAVSLDGDETGNTYRRFKNNEPSFKQVTENLDQVKKLYPTYFKKHISFLTVLHNKNSYASLYHFFHERYQKSPQLSSINTLNINEKYSMEFRETFLHEKRNDPLDNDTMNAMFTNLPQLKSMADMVEKYSGSYFEDFRQLIYMKKSQKDIKKYIPTATCLPFSLRVYFTADGSILPCEHIPRIFELGRFKKEKVSLDCHKISKDYNEYYQKIRPLCEACYIHDHCKECIFNTRIESKHPECDFFTDKKAFSDNLSENMKHCESNFPIFLKIIKKGLNA